MWIESLLRGHLTTYGYHGLVTFTLAAVTVIITLFFIKKRNGTKLPPGPVGLPLFGYYLFQRKDPIRKVSELAKKYGNVVGLYMGSQYVVVLNDWKAMTDAYSQPESLSRPPSLFQFLKYSFGSVGANGETWQWGRRLMSRSMKDIGLNKSDWEELVHEEVMDLMQRIAEEGEKPVQVRKVFAESFLSNIVTMILGQRLPPGHPLLKKMTEGVDAIIDFSPTLGLGNFSPILSQLLQVLGIDEENLLIKKATEFINFVSDTVDENIQNPPSGVEDSFIGRFLEEIQRNKNKHSYITVDNLKGNVMALLTGGGETTRSSIIWSLIAMADHQEIQQKVHQELDSVLGKDGSIRWKDRSTIPYTLATLFESMRWKTLVPFGTFRMASEDMMVQGYHIPKGTFVTSNIWLVHNDPRYWEKPEEFIPERFLLEDGKKVNYAPESFTPFSYGKRGCPGKLIAEMEVLLYFVTLMQKFKVVPKRGELKVQYDTILGLTYQPLNAELMFIPR